MNRGDGFWISGMPRTALLASLFAVSCGLPLEAKVPGQVHCYGRICHRVLSVDETRKLVGRSFDTATSYYDIPERDRFNTGIFTSSGERFDAWSAQRVSSSIYPDGTELLIWNPRNGHTAHVRVNDFGPFYARRTLDVTRRIADDLGFTHSGVAMLKVVVVAAPSPEEARHSKGRRYTRGYGFIGKFAAEDLEDVAGDLIADAENQRLELAALAAEQSAAARAATSGRRRMAWVQRVALTRAESSLSATSELLLAIARGAAQSPPLALVPRLPLTAEVATAQTPIHALKSAPEAIAATPPPLALAAATTLALPEAEEEPVAASEPGNEQQAAREQNTFAGDRDLDTSGTMAVVRSTVAGMLADARLRWLAAALLAFSLLLVTRASRERRPMRAGSRPPFAADRAARTSLPIEAQPTLPTAEAAADTLRARAKPVEPRPRDVTDLVRHARDLLAEGNPRQAEPILRLVLSEGERSLRADAAELLEPLAALADCVAEQGRHAEALALYGRAIAIAEAQPGAPRGTLADILEARALVMIRAGDPLAAAADAARAVELRADVHRRAASPAAPASDPDLGVALSILGEAYRQAGDSTAAEAAHRRALALFVAIEGSAGLRAAGSMTSLAEVLVTRGRAAEARSLLLAALPILEERLGLRHPGVAHSRATLASVHQAQGDIEEAVRLRRQSLAILENVEGRAHPDVVAARRQLAALIDEPAARLIAAE